MAAKTPQEWVEEMESLTAHPAWATFVDDVQGYKDAIRDGWDGHKSLESYHFARGRCAAFEQVVGLPKLVEQVKDSLKTATLPNAEEQYDAEDV